MKKKDYGHHHISRSDNKLIIGTQNPIPDSVIAKSDQTRTKSDANSESCPQSQLSGDSKQGESESNLANAQQNDNDPKQRDNLSARPRISSCPPTGLSKDQVLNYEVEEDETLEDISRKFSVPSSLIRSTNRLFDNKVHPGMKLKIITELQIQTDVPPIHASLFDAKGKTNHIKGKLSIKNGTLIFHPNSILHHTLKINLLGHLESSVIPHPDSFFTQRPHRSHHSSHSHIHLHKSDNSKEDTSDDSAPSEEVDSSSISLLAINYLKDPDDQQSISTEYFTGNKEELDKFHIELIKVADLSQAQNNYVAPDPDSILLDQAHSEQNILGSASKKPHNSLSLFKHNKHDSSVVLPPHLPQPPPSHARTMTIFKPTITLNEGTEDVFKMKDATEIRKNMPILYQNSDWTLLYKLSHHGCLLSTFFSKTQHKKPLVMFIRTSANEVIGAFISTEFTISDKYYGSGETFLFRLQPTFQAFHWDPVKNFNNRFYVLTTANDVTFGGGGPAAIFFGKDMYNGYSEECATYGSPQLTSTNTFKIFEIEVWQVGADV